MAVPGAPHHHDEPPLVRLRRAAVDAGAALSRTWGVARVVGLLDRLDLRSEHLLTVLMYHRIDDPHRTDTLDPRLVSATPDEFERQMAYLAARRPVLSLEDARAIRRGERRMPPGAVMVTFDDGYRDFGDVAFPILQRYGIPSTLFVATGYPDRPERAFWWDRVHHALATSGRREPLATPAGVLELATPEQREHATRQLRDWVWATPHEEAMAGIDELVTALGAPPVPGAVLTWDELRALHARGVALAPQTRSHPMLNRMPLERAQAEILGSVHDLEREIGVAPPVFAFPAGGYSEELVRWLGDAGFELAFTTERGANDLRDAEWLRMRRTNVGVRSSVPVVRTEMLSWVARLHRDGRRV